MTPNSAFRLINIEEKKDYDETPNGAPIFMIHCVKTNTKPAKLKTLGNATLAEFPAGSFIKGALYPIYLKQFIDMGGGEFVGYLYAQRPVSL